jgi:transposase
LRKYDYALIARLYREGQPPATIAQHVGIRHTENIYAILHREGVPLRRPRSAARHRSKDTPH